MKFFSLFALVCSPVSTLLSSNIPEHARGGKLFSDLLSTEALEPRVGNSTVNYFSQLIDHNQPAKGHFMQRFYVDTTHWEPKSGPVLMYIGGEGTLGGTPGGAVSWMAANLSALIVALEHRYYGESLPAPLTDRETLNTLSVDSAIADLAAFIADFKVSFLNGREHTWVSVGGSYPGALSAWFREKHPEHVSASWSSSGVVNAVYDYSDFAKQIATDVSAYPGCEDSLKAVTTAFEQKWDSSNPQDRVALRKLFNTPDYFSKADMAWMLADSAAMGCQYGGKAKLCKAVDGAAEPLEQFARYTKEQYGPNFGASCYYSTKCLSDPSMSKDWPGGNYAWVFQCCTQLAYWNTAYPGSIRSQLLTVDYFDQQCQAAFGTAPSQASIDGFNSRYGGATPNTTNVIALNGGDDPWRGAAVQHALSEKYPENTAVCDGCGHCGDLSGPGPTTAPAIATQHTLISEYLNAWVGKP